jgi:hypothetical protein
MFLEPNWPFEVARQKKDSLVALIGMLNCIGAALTPPIVVGVHAIIGPNGGGKDIFVHISAVELAGLNSLNERAPLSAVAFFAGRNLPRRSADYSAARIHALQRSIALAQRSDESTTLSCWSSRIALAFLAIESASVQIANHASALTTSAAVPLVYCKNSASPALRAMSITSSAVGVVLRDRNCISSHLTDRANSKSSWATSASKRDGSMFLSCRCASV